MGRYFGNEKEGVLCILKCFIKKIIVNYFNLLVCLVIYFCRKLVELGFLVENFKFFVLLDKYGRIELEVIMI